MSEHPKKKESDEFTEQSAMQVSGVYGKVAQTGTLLSNILKVAQMTLMGIPMIGQAINGFGLLWQIALSSLGLIKKEGNWSRGIKTVVGAASLSMLVASLLVAPATAVILGLVSIGLGYGQELWTLGAAFVSRATGSWNKEREALAQKEKVFYKLLRESPENLEKLTKGREKNNEINKIENDMSVLEQKIKYAELRDKEPLLLELNSKKIELSSLKIKETEFALGLSPQQNKILSLDKEITSQRNTLRGRDGELVDRSFGFLVGGLALAGAVMLITPLAPVGAAILLATSIYGFLKTFDPFGWSTKIKNQFFGPKTESVKEIKDKIGAVEDTKTSKGPALDLNKPLQNGEAKIFTRLASNDPQFAASIKSGQPLPQSPTFTSLAPQVPNAKPSEEPAHEDRDDEGEQSERRPSIKN